MIVMIPSGGSNLGSIVSVFERLDVELKISEDPDLIRSADKVILPGVGHAQTMMERLRKKGFDRLIPTLTQPVLGICLGMQILFEHSEEGDVETLGIIPAKVRLLRHEHLPVPHMGWNQIRKKSAAPLAQLLDESFVYFVHSYRADDGPWVQADCSYGEDVPALVQWRNFYGTQFHPERSGPVGEAFLRSFLCLDS